MEGIHLSVQKSLRSSLLLHQEKGREVTPSPRLPKDQRVDRPEPLLLTPHSRVDHQGEKLLTVHQV